MTTTVLVKRLRRAVNASKRKQLAVAESRIYAAIEAALNKYAENARSEWAEFGREFEIPEVTLALPMSSRELKSMLRRAIDEVDTLPLSGAEEDFYSDLHQTLLAYEDEVRLGHPASERRCMICGVAVSQCCC